MKTMTYEAFLPEIKSAVEKAAPDGVSVTLQSIRKNNGVDMDALVLKNDSTTAAPTIYVNPYYEDHKSGDLSIAEIADRIIWQYQNASTEEPFDLSEFTVFERIKDKIIMKLVNNNLNADLLKEIPHIDFLDLAVTFCLLIDMKDHCNATILIKNEHLNIWKKDTQDLYTLAKENTPRLLPWKFSNMADILGEMADDLQDNNTDNIPLYVLNNNNGMFGASVILYEGVLQKISDQIGGDYWIIPSSIHESLCVPSNELVDKASLDQMIISVNTSAVDDQEVLSDHCYYYNAEAGKIEIP